MRACKCDNCLRTRNGGYMVCLKANQPGGVVNPPGPRKQGARINVDVDDGERQLAIMALANLAKLMPGFDYALRNLAAKFERSDDDLYGQFKAIKSQPPRRP